MGTVKAAVNLVDPDREVTGKNVRDVFTLLSLATGVPVSIVGKAAGYARDVERGTVDPTSGADYARGLLTGKASGASRN